MLDKLPNELMQMIVDSACKIRCNDLSSNNIQIVVRTTCQPSSCSHHVLTWIMKCLEDRSLEYVRDECGQYVWYVACMVVNDVPCTVYETEGISIDIPLHPEMIIAIRAGSAIQSHPYTRFRNRDSLVLYNEVSPMEFQMAARLFTKIMVDVPPPTCVKEVGVSAVSDEYMRMLWSDVMSDASYTGTWMRFELLPRHERRWFLMRGAFADWR